MITKRAAFISVLCVTILILCALYIMRPHTLNKISMPVGDICTCTTIANNLLELRTELLTIWRYSRGEKVRKHARNALGKLEKQLRTLGVSTLPAPFNNRTHRRSDDVCPDKIVQVSSVKSSEILVQSYVPSECSYDKPLNTLVTVTLNFAGAKWPGIDTVMRVLNGIMSYAKSLRVVLAVSKDDSASQLKELKAGIEIIQIPETETDNAGKTWNALIAKTNTPYILIGRGLVWFTKDIKLERMIREITELGVSIVAGSYRCIREGHWILGCHQTDLMNHTLKYEAGYFESMHECVFCDYVTGPFVTRTETLAKLKFDETSFTTNDSEGLFEDVFFRLQDSEEESVVCPDSMFFKRDRETSSKKADWQAFANKWKLSRLITVGGHDLKYSCKEISVTCPTVKGLALAPCCLQDLADGLKFLSRFCAANNMTCESVGGTVLGALKFDSVLPWERDGDIRFLSVNYTKVKSLQSQFTAKGYSISLSDNRAACTTTPGGSAKVRTPGGWGLDFWAVCIPTSHSLEFVQQGIAPTKINIDGEWINTNRNPGSYCRDRYGEDIYTHVEHYFTFGGNSYSKYMPGYFASCPAKGRVERSGCLDQYFPDGSLQFG